MPKTLIGPRMRQLRREHNQTQAEMAQALGVSPSYINLLENNQRSLSVPMLMALSDIYDLDWRELTTDEASKSIADLRHAMQDPIFGDTKPDLHEIRAAIDHAPRLVEGFLQLYRGHRTTLEKIMRSGIEKMPEKLLETSPETVIHDFFRDHSNHFPQLEEAAERLRGERAVAQEDLYVHLKDRLRDKHAIQVQTRPLEEMDQTLRFYDEAAGTVFLSQALDHNNRVFQLAHVLGLIELPDLLDRLIENSGIKSDQGLARCRVELANYFAGAYVMPYIPLLRTAERVQYDIDRVAAAFAVSFEQVCHRLTTLQREGARGVPFFFLRIDKAGNVSKRFNSTSFNLAEYGGACPVWNIHAAFSNPGVIMPQFVELPDGERYFTISRTVHRPVFSQETQDRRLTLALGCELQHAHRIGYAATYNRDDERLFGQIGLNCHLCPRQACSQRAHQPLFVELPIDTNRRGNTRYES
ncbi:XRE family transcriptional regulator [Brevirhabdus pacifica]|uniref:XRE family transcriptional regulator n=2 Tax=Brevirhabdus pacifica TaxID=1267768 RepID=A0A1U7DJZ9_9RHOB|nr:XRE family transcriptional regulator [Brevirhabdus pacifica]APX90337.1 XRE family transcriptional regulator [Brevirhabdus pacifica]OWU78625.1 XRE family transcriptional regulator [Loktanella sp. 22II-4b]PJJ80790.1 hypothetical protein CLV77_3061 [Brevirhabdus pacifica]